MATTYEKAGVDQAKNNAAVTQIQRMMRGTFDRGVVEMPWGFAGLYSLKSSPLFDGSYKDPVLIACADGAGTKVKLAAHMKRYDTVGVDLVAMSVNDLICTGGMPLFFLDYIALDKTKPKMVVELAKGMVAGCKQSGCVLLGGETAEMPGVYRKGEYDLAGFAVGLVDRSKILDGKSVRPGDDLIALSSSGVHSNGYSLVRRIVRNGDLRKPFRKTSLGDTLLKPTRIYVKAIREVLKRFPVKKAVKAIAHITGGGLVENLPRVLPKNCGAEIQEGSWTVPPIFSYLQTQGGISKDEMFRVFNMGVGMVIITAPAQTKSIVQTLRKAGEAPRVVGKVVRGACEVRFRTKD